MLRRASVLLSFGLVVACGSGGSSGSPGAGGNLGQPGCTAAPECNGCLDCYSKCVCTTGDVQACPAACGLSSGGASGGGFGGTGNAPPTGGSPGTGGSAGPDDLASNIRVTEIAVYQAVKIPVMKAGAEVTQRNAQVVAGRDALVRVFVSPDPGFTPREIVGRLTLQGPGAGAPIEVKQAINAASSDASLPSTLNFEVPGAQISAGTTYSVTLLEPAPGGPPGAEDGARFPVNGAANLGAQSTGPSLNVTVVPIVVNGFTPGTSQSQMNILYNRLKGMYPTPDVKITVRAAVNYPSSVSATSGNSWSQALNFVESVRQQDQPPKNTFYFGMITPANSSFQFCGGGCIAGLSNQPGPNDVSGRCSIGLGFFNQGQNDPDSTMAHEVGHAHGVGHAPCTQFGGITGVDPNFPYNGGSIGTWGWDIIGKQLKNPAQFTDIMGYCEQEWISDYNYQKWFTRLAYVNSTAYYKVIDTERAPGLFRTLILDGDGSSSWGYEFTMHDPVEGEKRTVNLVDAQGNVTGSITGFYTPHDHGGGGFLRVRSSRLTTLAPTQLLKVQGAAALSVGSLKQAPN
ncbi:MAG: M66 family metalloprotease [Polyangiaceae bacterium]